MATVTEDFPVADQPTRLKYQLKWHQLAMVHTMLNAERSGFIEYMLKNGESFNENNDIFVRKYCNIGILADKVGSGKTYIILGLIASRQIPEQVPILLPRDCSGTILSPTMPNRANLIVVPHNILNQWNNIIKESGLTYLSLGTRAEMDCFFNTSYTFRQPRYYGNYEKCKSKTSIAEAKLYFADRNIEIPKGTLNFWREDEINVSSINYISNKLDIVLISASVFSRFIGVAKKIKWARIILDEASSIPVKMFNGPYASFYWLVTATPTYNVVSRVSQINIENRLITYKNDPNFIDKIMTIIPPAAFIIRTNIDRASKLIASHVSKQVLNMINTGNITGAVTELNCGIDTSDNIITAFTKSLERDIIVAREKIELYTRYQILTNNNSEGKIEKQKKIIEEKQAKIDDIKEKIMSVDSELCFICADEYQNPTITECCKHIFCLVCLTTSIANNGKCPYCRQNPKYSVISDNKAVKKQEVKNEFLEMDKNKAFITVLNYLYDKDPKAKILIFSFGIDHCYDICKKHNIKYSYVKFKGPRAFLNSTMEKYSKGEINLLLLDPSHYAAGMNIQNTDYVIMHHRLHASDEIQGIGRAQRYGRTTQLKIIYLCNDTESTNTPYESTNISTFDDLNKI